MARDAGSDCVRAVRAPSASAARVATAHSAAPVAITERDLSIPRSPCGSPIHLAGGSSPQEADLPSRAGVELAPHGSVSWLADRRLQPPSPGTSRGGTVGVGSPLTVARQR